MTPRRFWLNRVSEAWNHGPIVWLMGVRGVGKTSLGQAIGEADHLDCEHPGTRNLLGDPAAFLRTVRGRTIVLDQAQRLGNVHLLLDLAAAGFTDVRILATGTLPLSATAPAPPATSGAGGWPPVSTSASGQSRDALAGRKSDVWLTPMTMFDMEAFGSNDLRRRMLRGGLPQFFLAERPLGAAIEAWTDAFWARDIQEPFRLERGAPFRRLFERLMAQSGSMFEASRLAKPCGASRTTIANYLAVLEAALAVHVIRPFAAGGRAEIVSAPKVYGFDTAFVCHYRGATSLRQDDLAPLWKHLVLNELHAHLGRGPIRYWRTKHGSEVDFVIVRYGRLPAAVQCCWSASDFEPGAMRSFRGGYPGGPSFVVTADTPAGGSYDRTYGALTVRFVSVRDLVRQIQTAGR